MSTLFQRNHFFKLSETKNRIPGDGEFIGVPGELRGFEKAWKKFGSLPWKDLFEPAIEIATKGFKATPALVAAVEQNAVNVTNDPGLRCATCACRNPAYPSNDDFFLITCQILTR